MVIDSIQLAESYMLVRHAVQVGDTEVGWNVYQIADIRERPKGAAVGDYVLLHEHLIDSRPLELKESLLLVPTGAIIGIVGLAKAVGE